MNDWQASASVFVNERERGTGHVVRIDPEAGGKATDSEGGNEVLESGTIVAGNLEVHPLLLARLQAAK